MVRFWVQTLTVARIFLYFHAIHFHPILRVFFAPRLSTILARGFVRLSVPPGLSTSRAPLSQLAYR
jgi:hypothetical protein